MLTRFCYQQNLRHLFAACHLPPHVRSLIGSFVYSFENDHRGTLSHDMFSASEVPNVNYVTGQVPSTSITDLSHDGGTDTLNDDIELALRRRIFKVDQLPENSPFNRNITRLSECEDGGQVYRPVAVAPIDSYVLFVVKGDIERTWRAGCIRDIFMHSRRVRGQRITEMYLAVDEFPPVDADIAAIDPYLRYGLEDGGCLFRASHEGVPYIISKADLLCHIEVAMPKIDGFNQEAGEYIRIKPWNKVRDYF